MKIETGLTVRNEGGNTVRINERGVAAVEKMASNGVSFTSIAKHLKVHRKTFLEIRERQPDACVDNARELQGRDVLTMIRETNAFYSVTLPKKGRRAERRAVIGSMLQAAVEKIDQRPHLYVTDRCPFLIHALSNSVRDERDPDDVADVPGCPDHPLDAAAYLINKFRTQRVRSGRTTGHY